MKFNDSITSSQINSFLTIKGLNIKGKPMLGWYNLYVDSASDVFTKYVDIYNHTIISKSYIQTLGKYLAMPSDPLFSEQWYLQKNQCYGCMGYYYW